MKRVIGILVPAFLCATATLAVGQVGQAKQQYAKWSFADDFSHGIPGWMSYPLAQDVGYDPSTYTKNFDGKFAMVRDVTAEGQMHLRVGLARPVQFHATPDSVINIKYKLLMSGKPGKAEIVLGSVAGTKYEVPLPQGNGEHALKVRGSELKVPAAGTEAQVITVEADTEGPILGSQNQLIIESFTIDAENIAPVPFSLPTLAHQATMRIPVADTVVDASHEELDISSSAASTNTDVNIYDGDGKLIHEQTLGDGHILIGASAKPGLYRAELKDHGARSDFKFLVLGNVPAHPRLLLTPERLVQLRTQMPSDALRIVVHERAVASAAAIAYNPKAGDVISRMSPDTVFTGLKEYMGLLGAYGNAIETNALDYQLSGSKESLDAARRALLAASQWVTWTPVWFRSHGLHTYYPVGEFIQQSAFGYDLIADQLSPQEKIQIANGFYKNAILPTVQEYFLNDRMSTGASNHMAHSVGGAIEACLAVYGDVPDWNTRFAPALAELMVSNQTLLDGLYPGDDSETEPAGYEFFGMEGMAVGAASLQRVGITQPGTDRMIQSFWWPRYVQYGGNHLLDTGDWHGEFTALSGFGWAAEYANDPTLRAFYDSAVSRSLKSLFSASRSGEARRAGTRSTSGNAQRPAPDKLDLICCTKPAGAVPAAPLSKLFPIRGSAALRSGWSQQDTVISLRVGAWFNHEHHDEGSFQVAMDGEELIDEAGYANYYSEPRYQDYFTQASGHNTVLVDNDNFSQDAYEGRYWKALAQYPAITQNVLGDAVDYLSADLTTAYDGTLKSYTRTYLFLKPGVLIVHDDLHATTPHTYSFLLHVPPGITPTIDRTRATIGGKNASAAIVAAGTSAAWHAEQTPIPVDDYGPFDTKTVLLRSMIHLESRKSNDATFTVGMLFHDNKQADASLHSISTSNAVGVTSADGNLTALYRKSAGPLMQSGYSTDGSVLAFNIDGESKHVFAAGARSLSGDGIAKLAADVPLDVELTQTAHQLTLNLYCAKAAAIAVGATPQIQSMNVDGRAIQSADAAQIKLSAGEHRVVISY